MEVTLDGWLTGPEYQSQTLPITVQKFHEITDLLFERPNLNSSHLFRADILFDSAAKLKTIDERPGIRCTNGDTLTGDRPLEVSPGEYSPQQTEGEQRWLPTHVSGYELTRRVIRRLIPRKPQLDRPLEQSCFVYNGTDGQRPGGQILVIYVPHVDALEQVPWYHPQTKSLAYHYHPTSDGAIISVHYEPFPGILSSNRDRLHRTLVSLIHTFVRLSKLEVDYTRETSNSSDLISTRSLAPAVIKDTILPQNIVQDTYTRLKQQYASDLISRWVEKTDPSKHVFEDLSIAAFLIELWNTMYERQSFPGFVDIACGNGVLVYVLNREGYKGHGFDARHRKTWEILGIDEQLEEKLCIPKPFLDNLDRETLESLLSRTQIQDGTFEVGTFIISNHADELTLWTPLLAAMSCSEQPLPFLAIPCCSHALSGAKRRFSLKDIDVGHNGDNAINNPDEDDQSVSGDLKALRKAKINAATHTDSSSMYACLTKKTIALSEELRFETEVTLLRIPSTRNIGIVGNRRLRLEQDCKRVERTQKLLERECDTEGGIAASARAWVEGARKHIEGKGRGKLNLRGEPS